MNDEFANFLRPWELLPSGGSVPLSHARTVAGLHALDPSRDGQDILDGLVAAGLVTATVSGEYTLTESGVAMRRTLPQAAPAPNSEPKYEPVIHDPREWERFRSLCDYWIECVRLSEWPQEALFVDGENRDWFVPRFDAAWLPGLAVGKTREVTIRTERKHAAARARILTRQDEDEEITVGYPVRVFVTRNGTEMVVPLGLVPADLVRFSDTTMTLRLRLDEADVNSAWIEWNVPEHRRKGFLKALFQTGGEIGGSLDLNRALPLLEAETPRAERCEVNPDKIDWKVPDAEVGRPRVANVPVLFVGQALQFSKNLSAELRHIREQPAETLDGTALAYFFREHPLPNALATDAREPVPFLPSNPEQREACFEALSRPVSKIQGPPGTGKSHASVNIIANFLYRGESVLFTSKNHKAVEAIAANAAAVLDGTGLDLVQFCGGGSGQAANPWYRQDLDALVDRAAGAGTLDGLRSAESLDSWVRRLKAIGASADARTDVLRRYEDANHEAETWLAKIEGLFPSLDARNNDGRKVLRLLAQIMRLRDPEETAWSWRHPVRSVRWRFCGGKKRMERALAELHASAPGLVPAFLSRRELRAWARECRRYVKALSAARRKMLALEPEARLASETAAPASVLAECLRAMEPLAKPALAARLAEPIAALAKDRERVESLKAVMAFLRKANSPWFFSRIDENAKEHAKAGFAQFQKAFPGWAATLLSLVKASPCLPAVFDRVIIDEASQCEVPPIIPALFRAKGATIVGDPNQFPPVRTLQDGRNAWLRSKFGLASLDDERFDFLSATAYSVCPARAVLFREHFRCHPEIAEYFNAEFYGGELRVRTVAEKLGFPRNMGYAHAIEWIHVEDSAEEEDAAVEREIRRLVNNGYAGSVGVVTPFRERAEALGARLHDFGTHLKDFTVGTANAFQGGERDVIFFVIGYTSALSKGQSWYAEADDNRYIYNVAASRARACLRIVGDRERCAASPSAALRALSRHPQPSKTRHAGHSLSESPWEEKLLLALRSAGIEPVQQYETLGRRLDMALFDGDRRLDIEVDGVKYHTDANGNRNVDDIRRDEQLLGGGWDVMRFWVYELRDDMDGCVAKIKNWLKA